MIPINEAHIRQTLKSWKVHQFLHPHSGPGTGTRIQGGDWFEKLTIRNFGSAVFLVLLDSGSLACETSRILRISVAFVGRDFWILANRSFTDHHTVLVVVENQSVRRVSCLLPQLDDAQRIVVEI